MYHHLSTEKTVWGGSRRQPFASQGDASEDTRPSDSWILDFLLLKLEWNLIFTIMLLKHTYKSKKKDKECRQWDETSAHKPHDAEGGHREPKQVHTSPVWQRPAQGAETGLHSPATYRVSLGDWGKPTQVATMQKDTHKLPPSKFRPAVQGRTEEQKHWQWFPRTNRGLVALELYWESHFEAAWQRNG